MTNPPAAGDPRDPAASAGRPPIVDPGPMDAGPDGPSPGRGADPAAPPGAGRGRPDPTRGAGERPRGMLPARGLRPAKLERGSMRILATGGIVGLDTALGAILVGQDVAGWIVGLTLGLVAVILAAVLWSSRQL